MFSVIVPVYNREKSISRTIKSVLDQTYKDFELIVVDDCSTDNSWDIISEIKDDHIISVKLSKNSGAAAARNQGIKLSRGKYISLLDSDDYYEPEFLELTAEALERTENNIGFSWTGVRYLQNNLKNEFIWVPQKRENPYLTFLHSLHIGTNSGVTFKKEVFENTGYFNTRLPAAEDTDFFLRLSQDYSYSIIPKILVNIERDGKDRLSKNFKRIAEAYEYFLPQHFFAINRDDKLKKKYYYKMMWLSYHNGDKKKADFYYGLIPPNLRTLKVKIVKFLYEYFPLKAAFYLHQKCSS